MKITKRQLRNIIKEALDETDVPKRKGIPEQVDELIASPLFSNANPEDKAKAHKIILDAIMGLEYNGGNVRWDEEYMVDAFRPHPELKERLAAAAPESGPGYWLDSLVSWSNGHKDYLDWL